MVMGKHSYLFCRTEEACHRAALMYSMLGACKVLGKDAKKWLAYTLKHIVPTTARVPPSRCSTSTSSSRKFDTATNFKRIPVARVYEGIK